MTDSHSTNPPPHSYTELVPVNTRRDGWTPQRQRGFLEELADSGCVETAAAAVGMTAASAYRLRRRTDAAAFDAAWSRALEKSIERLAAMAVARAIKGTVKRRFYRGELIDQQVVHSERMTIYLLEKGQAALGRAAERQRGAADWTMAMNDVVRPHVRGEPEGGYRVWKHKNGVLCTNFPPPHGFDGFEEGAPGMPGYNRTLTDQEAAAEKAQRITATRAGEAARRAYFGRK